MIDGPPWMIVHPRAKELPWHDVLGYLPEFLSQSDPRPAAEQFNDRYGFGGGWHPLAAGLRLVLDGPNPHLAFFGDPPYPLVAMTRLREERIYLFSSAWVAIVQPDGSHEIARMD